MPTPTDRDLLVSANTKLDALLSDVHDHETRLRWIERWMWKAVGAASFASAGGAFAAARAFGH